TAAAARRRACRPRLSPSRGRPRSSCRPRQQGCLRARNKGSLGAGPGCAGGLRCLYDDDLQFARAVLLAVRRGLEVFGGLVAGDRLLEARKLDDDEAVELLRALQDPELAAARQDLAAELSEDGWHQVGVLLVLIGIVNLRACDPIG